MDAPGVVVIPDEEEVLEEGEEVCVGGCLRDGLLQHLEAFVCVSGGVMEWMNGGVME